MRMAHLADIIGSAVINRSTRRSRTSISVGQSAGAAAGPAVELNGVTVTQVGLGGRACVIGRGKWREVCLRRDFQRRAKSSLFDWNAG